jgi:hypothetical protein
MAKKGISSSSGSTARNVGLFVASGIGLFVAESAVFEAANLTMSLFEESGDYRKVMDAYAADPANIGNPIVLAAAMAGAHAAASAHSGLFDYGVRAMGNHLK